MTKNESNRRWYAANKERERKKRRDNYHKNRDRYLAKEKKRKYKNYHAHFDGFILSQNGRCRICFRELQSPQLDHDHITGKIRGLLCRTCNLGLGHFFDSVELLENAVKYLKENQNGKASIKYGIKKQSYCPPYG